MRSNVDRSTDEDWRSSPTPTLQSSRNAVLWTAILSSLLAPKFAMATGDADRSPVDLLLTANEDWALTVNQTADSVSLVRVATGEVACEVPVGRRPSAIALSRDEKRVLVTATFAGELRLFDLAGASLAPAGVVRLGFEPRGVAIAPDGKRAYVALTTAHAIAVVDLDAKAVVAQIPTGRWPRYLALTPDGRRLAVGVNGDRGVAVIDVAHQKTAFVEKFLGMNLGQMEISRDGAYAYFPWITYVQFPTTPSNIQQGWVLGSRIGRVRLERKARREAITLDPRGEAVADPHGLALSPDEQWLAVAASGSHELLVYRLPGLPFQDYGGPGDHIAPELLSDGSRFFRIRLGGRPMAIRFSKDGQRVYVANYLQNAIQIVNVTERRVERSIPLGGPQTPSLARRGEALFHDGQRSLDQWYSCHSCHYEGHVNAVAMDTNNDGGYRSFKAVLSLRNVTRTGPWTWHGWQTNLSDAIQKSFADTMRGPELKPEELEAVVAYLKTLEPPPNPNRSPDGTLTEAAVRGEKIFQGEKAGCARCHDGPLFTDGAIHDVGLSKPEDRYDGYNTPSLLGVYDRVIYLHDGETTTLEEVLSGPHNPAKITGQGELTDAERDDLIAYLRSL